MVLELKDKLTAVDSSGKPAPMADAGPAYSMFERDVLSSTKN
jgi:hypothetical protein